jgi:hypothetical protein
MPRLLSTPLLMFLLLAASGAMAQPQHFNIRGKLRFPAGISPEKITLTLLRAADSGAVKFESPDAGGSFVFEQIPAADYFLKVTHPGMSAYTQRVLLVDKDLDLGNIVVAPKANDLTEAVVTAMQPLIQRQFDKTIVNVASSIQAAGNTAFEVLRQSPGVNIDQNDNISMRGRAGIMVMIDGKRIFMSGAELANLLRSTPANAIDKIELITNPSAKYDAQGNAIINIRMKKDSRIGSNGTLTGSFGQGRYTKGAGGLSLNHRDKKLNVFGSYNYNYRGDFNDLQLQRSFYQQGVYAGAYDQANLFNYANNTHSVRLGADYNISSKTVAGIAAGGFIYGSVRTNENNSNVLDARQAYISSFRTYGDTKLGRNNGFANLNLKHQFDSSGSELTVDLDYAKYGSTDRQDYTTLYSDVKGNPLRTPYLLHGDLNGGLEIYSAKADYTKPIRKMKFEAGIKSSLVAADNDLQFRDRSDGGDLPDTTKSNHFLYNENINAAYANLNGSKGKLDWQLGLRVENTNSKGRQLTDGQSFNRNYTQLFPNVYLGYHLQAKHELGLSVSRRINRPTYNQLNPFKSFLDPSTYAAGNPYLKPELSIASELSYTYDQRFIVQLSYTRNSDNMITVLVPVAGQEKVIIQTDLNAGYLDYYAASLTIPLKAGKWLSSTNTVNAYYASYHGEAANTILSNARATFDFNSTNVFTLGKNYSAELNLTYQSPVAYGFMTQEQIGFASLGIQKQFRDRKANLKLNVSDIFWTSKVRANTEVTGYKESFYQQRDTRYVMLSFSLRFGKSGVAPSRRRSSGVEDEKRRAG